METGKVVYTKTRIVAKEADLPILRLGQLGYAELEKKLFIGNGVKNVDVSTVSTDLILDGAITENKLAPEVREKINPPITKLIEDDYLITAEDIGIVLLVNAADGSQITIPEEDNYNIPLNTEIAIVNVGEEDILIGCEEDVIINEKDYETTYKVSGGYSAVALKKIGTNNWILLGKFEEV